ncbi:MAG: hypothetical protein P4L76_11080 [Beijerinckiaceae bacterium]|nr:hypothetical protein [Beijerinckiaceae bacterium]
MRRSIHVCVDPLLNRRRIARDDGLGSWRACAIAAMAATATTHRSPYFTIWNGICHASFRESEANTLR